MSLRAVWSFWSRPYQAYYGASWGDPMTHALSWVLSVNVARLHYNDTLLVTDTPGRRLLVDRLGLEFAAVSTELDRLGAHDPGWWALGKLVAYRLQTTPYVHIDSDAYLWKPLPPALEAAPVLAQHPEYHRLGQAGYHPDAIEQSMAAHGGVLPAEWEWARSRGPMLRAENCGILGGQDTAFLRHYANQAIATIERPENAPAWEQVGDKRTHNLVVEQFLLSACLGFHRDRDGSPFFGVRAAYLFPSWSDATDANQAARRGYTHLMAWSKGTPAARRRLEARVRRDYPDYLRRCERARELLIA
jgi:hypothetical protein